jgi:hypothetical protein
MLVLLLDGVLKSFMVRRAAGGDGIQLAIFRRIGTREV